MTDKEDVLKNALNFFDGNELAATTYLNKYALKDKEGNYVETDPLQTIVRVMKVLADAMPEEKTVNAFFDKNGKPTCKLSRPSEEWLKRVLKEEYDPTRSDRQYTWLEIFGKACNNFVGVCPQGSILSAAGDYEKPQSISNCYVIDSPQDSVSSIMRAGEESAHIYRRRGGVGIDISHLRPKGTPVANAAKVSSGAVGWMEYFSGICRVIGQDSRRGALLLSIDIKHPDALAFAEIKQDLTRVTGANISIKLSDEFMKAVEKGTTFTQQWPVDSDNPEIICKVDAKETWKRICNCAWSTGEPGLLFFDEIKRNLPSEYYWPTLSCNPCITGDSWIFTDTGPKQVIDLMGVPFNSIINGKTYPSTNQGFFYTGIQEVYKLITQKGFEVKATLNHKFKTITNIHTKDRTWVTLKDLKLGDWVCVPNERDKEWDGVGSFELGWLLGNLKGDGSIVDKTALLEYWGDSRFSLLTYALNCIDKSNLKHKLTKDNACGNVDRRKVSIKVKELKQVAIEFGMTQGNSKTISTRIEKTSSNFHKGFIRGWFDADGSVQGSQYKGVSVRLCSIDVSGLKAVQRMLARLGIISTIYVNRKAAGNKLLPNGLGGYSNYHCQATHELCISRDNLYIFKELVGFADPQKQHKLEQLLLAYKRKPNKERFIDRIISIEKIGEETVYDCTIPGISAFNANGLEVHNCGEQPLPAGESCRLISMCLIKYIVNAFQKDAYFDFIAFERDIRIAMRMMDAVVSEEQNCLKRIIAKIEEDTKKLSTTNFSTDLCLWKMCLDKGQQGRRCGLGTHGLGDCLAQLCLRYDSDKTLVTIKSIYETLRNIAYDESIEMSKEYGPFPAWDWEKEKECEFFKRFPTELLEKMKNFGRRNMVILTNSPTGSISILSQTSSGIEPTFRQSYTRRRKINHADQESKIDFVDQNGDKWEEFIVFEKNVERYFNSIGKKCPTDLDNLKLPEFFVSSDQIDWKQRVEIQSIITSMMDASISSTINLPKEVTVELVQSIYELAWKKKLKGTTVYRESSRSGVLLSKKEKDLKQIVRSSAPDRPKKLPCEINFVSIKGSTYVVIVGLLNNAVYEIFCGEYSNQIPKKQYSGYVERKKKGEYFLCFLDDEQLEFREININEYFDNTEYASVTRLISMSLRHGVPLTYITDQLKKSSSNITEFGSAVSRILKKYIKLEDLTNLYTDCSSCHSKNIEIKHESGCYSIICKDCNFIDSKCG